MPQCLPQPVVFAVVGLPRVHGACGRRGQQFQLPAQGTREIDHERRQGREDLGRRLHQLGALAQQPVAAAGHRVVDRTGHREYLAAHLGGQAGGDQGAGFLGGLDHQRAQAEPGEDAVATWEMLAQRPGAGGVLTDYRTGAGDLLQQRPMTNRIGDVGAGAEHRHGRAGDVEGGLVRGGVDPGGQPAGDAEAGLGQCAREQAGIGAAAGGGRPAAHHRHRRSPQQARVAGDEQHRRRRGDTAEQGWIGVVAPADQIVAGGVQPALAARECAGVGCADGVAGVGIQAMAGPVALAGAATQLGVAMGVQQAAQGAGRGAAEQQAEQAGVFGRGRHVASIPRKRRRRPGAPSRSRVGKPRVSKVRRDASARSRSGSA